MIRLISKEEAYHDDSFTPGAAGISSMTRLSPGATRPMMPWSATRWSNSAAIPPSRPGTGSIGAMRDDANLLEEVTQDIMESRQSPAPRPSQGLIGVPREDAEARPGRRACHEGPRGAAVAVDAG